MLLRYFLNSFEVVSVVHIITGITFVVNITHTSYFCGKLFVYDNFSASFSITFLIPEIAVSINTDVSFWLPRIMMSGLFLATVLKVFLCGFHNTVTLHSGFVSTYPHQ